MVSLLLAVVATCCASQHATGDESCAAVVDRDVATMWHTPYSGAPPHWVELRFPEPGRVYSCLITHRPEGGVNGTPESVIIAGSEIYESPLWPDGPDGIDQLVTFDPPMLVAHDDHPIVFHFTTDYQGNPWTALAEIDCDFQPTQEPTVEPPCEDYGYSPTPTFAFDFPADVSGVGGASVYVTAGTGDPELVHVINCGFGVVDGALDWRCPTTGRFAIQRYATLPPCSTYSVHVRSISRDGTVESDPASDDTNWTWSPWWECDTIGGCSPQDYVP